MTFILAGLLLTLNFTMRNVIWKTMQRYNVDKTRYEKLALANHLSGQTGVKYELKALAKHDPSAADFVDRVSARIKETKDIRQLIRSSMAEDRDNITRLRRNRFVLSGIIYLVLAGQALMTGFYWWKENKHHFQKSAE